MTKRRGCAVVGRLAAAGRVDDGKGGEAFGPVGCFGRRLAYLEGSSWAQLGGSWILGLGFQGPGLSFVRLCGLDRIGLALVLQGWCSAGQHGVVLCVCVCVWLVRVSVCVCRDDY